MLVPDLLVSDGKEDLGQVMKKHEGGGDDVLSDGTTSRLREVGKVS